MDLLTKEKDVVGVYISGHPLDDYRLEIDNFVNSSFDILKNMEKVKGRDLRFTCSCDSLLNTKKVKMEKNMELLSRGLY